MRREGRQREHERVQVRGVVLRFELLRVKFEGG